MNFTFPLLILALLVPAWVAWSSRIEMGRFRAADSSQDLAATYRRWTRISFLAHFVTAAAALAVMGRLRAVLVFPAEFSATPLSGALLAGPGDSGFLGLSDIAIALVGGAAMGLAVVTAALILRQRRSPNLNARVLGEVERFIPATPQQRLWWAVLSINAGISEELFYRLLLPLLLILAGLGATASFVVSAAIFGLAHVYQGVRGVLTSVLVGLLLTALYLATHNLVLVMALHILIDLRLLLLSPRRSA